jgi:hypothetical protein
MNTNLATHILSEEIIEGFIEQELSIFINFSDTGNNIQILSKGTEIIPECLVNKSGKTACLADFINVSLKIPEEFLELSPENLDQIQNSQDTLKVLNAMSWCIVNGKLKKCAGACPV